MRGFKRNLIFMSLTIVLILSVILLGCGGGGGGGSKDTPQDYDVGGSPVITKDSGWAIENIDPSFWTKWGYSANITAYCNFWVYASDPDGIDDIAYVTVTSPEGIYWVLRDSSTGEDQYDSEGGFFGGWLRNYDSGNPHAVNLGEYSVLVRDSDKNEATGSINVSSPESVSDNGFIYTEDYAGSIDDGIEMLYRAHITDFTKEENNITIEFLVDDERVYGGYVWFYDESAEYITWSDLFNNTINSGAGIYNDGTTNILQIHRSDLDLGSYTWDDLKGFHVVLMDGAQYIPYEYWDHRSISPYMTFPDT